jgi:Tol biopolymer transport system component/predicted Ser/Thr protein kinase
MPLSPGCRLGPYEITAPIGAGGMGEVYRARDSQLNRDVAIKVLPAALAGDAQYMARFEREAQMLAALNHPNIAAIYGIEQGAIVMELIEGEDLKGPVPVETAIHYARQIAIALEAAHEKGIIHRDLKPANIKVTPDGTVKLLDFGLAKAGDDTPSAISTASPTISPTLSLAMTEAGVILGTAAYMSPEQARGKAADKRADIWAFGVVLYELLAGKMLFGGGETVSDSLAAVLTREPDFKALPANTPPRVRRLLERCLRKDSKQRLRDIGEARILLDEPEAEAPVAAPRRSWLPWVVAALALLGAGGAWLRPKTSDPGPGVSRFLIPLPPGTSMPVAGAATQWVPSPDGRNLALIAADTASGETALWVRPLGATSAHRLDKTEGANLPFWSPDGQFIAFFAEEKLQRVAVSGGSVQTVCEVPTRATGATAGDGGTWNQEGVIVFAGFGTGVPLMRVPAVGGVPTAVTALEKDEVWHSWPQFLPDGRHLLYFAVNKEAADGAIYVQELGSTKRVFVLKNTTRGMWAPPGYLLFVREGTLFAQRMDAKTFQLEGEPLAVAQDVAVNESNGRNAFAVSRNGVLAYRSGTSSRIRQLTWYGREGKPLGAVSKPGELRNASLSPDEKSLAVSVGAIGKLDTWVMDLTSGVITRMTRDSRGSLSRPVWSPDSQRLVVTRYGGGIQEITLASGKVTPLGEDFCDPEDWSPDGRSILCNDQNARRLSLLSLADGAKLQTILDTPYRKTSFRFTPDGQFVVYVSYESGPPEIYVASFPSFAAKRKISNGGARSPVWAKSGKEIFYRADNGTLMNAEIRTGSKIEAGIPKPLFKHGTGALSLVAADGKRFLINEPVQKGEGERPEISLVLNWAADIK